MNINITDKIPPPKKDEQPKTRKGRVGDGRQDAILALKVGESFFLRTSVKSAGSLRHWARAKHEDRDYAAKSEKDGCRIWRTA